MMQNYIESIARTAKQASAVIAAATTAEKNELLNRFAGALQDRQGVIVAANQQDLAAAAGLSAPLRDRLMFQEREIQGAVAGIMAIAAQPDPIGTVGDWQLLPSGIRVGKMRVPLGVILMIYESRPGVTADAAALAMKAGNAIILRGGSEALQTNCAIGVCLEQVLTEMGLSGVAQVVNQTDRAVVEGLLARRAEIDLVIPRGGRSLIEKVLAVATMPVLKHLEGNCHVYVDEGADSAMAVAIVDNAKTRRYGVCNAAESVLVHRQCAGVVLPLVGQVLAEKGVEMRVCPESLPFLQGVDGVVAATEADWSTEFLAAIVSVRLVDSFDEAVVHINRYGSGHTDAIVTNNMSHAWRFWREVDSSSVMVNASTGFADGGEYGLGAEIGISTDKMHARGPVGILGLTSEKYVVLGSGECRL